jgi:NodT family efflux transporter outer membrane factor (OMF) lipoprotein
MKFLIFLLSLILTACTVGPNYQIPTETIPTHYTAGGKHVSASSGNHLSLNLFRDPLLNSLIAEAINGNNFDVQTAKANIVASRAALGIANANFLPEINANARVTRDHLSKNGELLGSIPFPIKNLFTDYTAGFDASWELDLFGGTRRSAEAARAKLQSVMEQQKNIFIMTAAEVARTYIEYRVYQQRIILAKHSIETYTETQKLTKLLVDTGEKSRVDLNRIESETLSAKANLHALLAEEQATLNALAVLVGEYPENLSQRLRSNGRIPTLNTHIYVGLTSDLLKRRPDIQVAERELAVATANIGVAVSNLYPQFQLVGKLGTDTIFPGTFSEVASRYWSWGPRISIPLFQGGKLHNAVDQTKALQDVALINYRKTILTAFADVESSLIRYDQERAKKRDLQHAYAEIKTALRLTRMQYQNGSISLSELLDVERQVDSLGAEYCQSSGRAAINLVALYKALGGEWA